MKARDLRYGYDKPWRRSLSEGIELLSEEHESLIQQRWLSKGIRVVPALFPELANIVSRSSKRILQDADAPDVFVVQSTDLQAFCIEPHRASRPVIILSSALIALLKMDELSFVVGHELAHFLFRHHSLDIDDNRLTPGQKLQIRAQQRAAEISADRVGFAACSSRTAAFRALSKAASGLGDRHLQLDVNVLLEQLNELKNKGRSDEEAISTHPMFLLRLRALLWFEMGDLWSKWRGIHERQQLSGEKIDDLINAELSELSGVDSVAQSGRMVKLASLWGTLFVFLDDEDLSMDEQEILCERFGTEIASKAIKYAQSFGSAGVKEKYLSSVSSLIQLPEEERVQFINYIRLILRESGLSSAHQASTDALAILDSKK